MRTIHFGSTQGKRGANRISTCRYSLLNFVPLALYDFVIVPLNAIYIVIAFAQQIPNASPSWQYDTFVVVIIAFLIQTSQAVQRELAHWKSDSQINAMKAYRYSWTRGQFKACERQDIAAGDIVMVRAGETVPVDMVILRIVETAASDGVVVTLADSSEQSDIVLVSTAKIDGESAPKKKQHLPLPAPLELLKEQKAHMILPPNNEGSADFNCKVATNKYEIIGDADCFVPAEAELTKNTGYVIGAAVYVGHECSFMIGSGVPNSDCSRTANDLTKWQFAVIVGVLIVSVLTSIFSEYFFIIQPGYRINDAFNLSGAVATILTLILFVPFTSVTTASICRSYICGRIQREMEGVQIYKSQLIDDLGAVSYMVMDKTGTLTMNRLDLKHIVFTTGAVVNVPAVQHSTQECMPLHESFLNGAQRNEYNKTQPDRVGSRCIDINAMEHLESKADKDMADTLTSLDIELYIGMALCHTVIPAHGTRPMHAESTDEVAILEGLARFGINVATRNSKTITLSVGGTSVVYSILQVLQFESKRMRMSVVVQKQGTDEIVLCTKGADVAVQTIATRPSQALEEASEKFASRGMRVLVYGQRTISSTEWTAWQGQLQAAQALPDKKKRASGMRRAYDALEQQLTIIGATVVEDVLHCGAREAVMSAREADIHVWIATGDTHHTAVAVARDVGLVGSSTVYDFAKPRQLLHSSPGMHSDCGATPSVYEKSELAVSSSSVLSTPSNFADVSDQDLSGLLDQLERALSEGPTLLTVSGSAVASLIETHATRFIALASKASAVVCYRCSPAHKGLLVRTIMAQTKKICIAVGDGSNDVDMLGAASVGIAVAGSEGSWAHSASGVGLVDVGQLRELLLVHGNNAQLGVRRALCYFQYKTSALTAASGAYFAFVHMSSAVPYSTSMYMNHNVGYTIFGSIALSAFDSITAPNEVMVENPVVYNLSREHKGIREYLLPLLLGSLQGIVQIVVLGVLACLDTALASQGVFMCTSYTALLLSNQMRGWMTLRLKRTKTCVMMFYGVFMWGAFAAFIDLVFYASLRWEKPRLTGLSGTYPSIMCVHVVLYMALLVGIGLLIDLGSTLFLVGTARRAPQMRHLV